MNIYFSVGYVVQIIVVYNPDNYLALVVKNLSSASKLFSVGSFVGLYFRRSWLVLKTRHVDKVISS